MRMCVMNESQANCSNCSSLDVYFDSQKVLINWVYAPLSSIIIVGNLVIITGIISNRRLHNPTNYYLLSLLLADLCTGIILPSFPKMSFKNDFAFQVCFFFYLFPNFIVLSLLSNLLMVHYDRYVCIIHPFHYEVSWIHRYFPIVILTAWVLPLLFASLPVTGWNNWKSGCCCSNLVFSPSYICLEIYGLLIPSIFAITGMTIRILHVAWRQMKAIKKIQRAVQKDSTSLERQLDFKHAKSVIGFFFIFLLCWVPYIVFIQVNFFVKNNESMTHIILSSVGISNAALIPFVLIINNKEYFEPWKKAFHRIGQCCAKDNLN